MNNDFSQTSDRERNEMNELGGSFGSVLGQQSPLFASCWLALFCLIWCGLTGRSL